MGKSGIEKRFNFVKRLINKLLGNIDYRCVEFVDDFVWRCQRFWRGYADVDVWNIDSWLSNVMPKVFDQFLEELHGYPSQIDAPKKVNGGLAVNSFNENEEDARFEKWKSMIREMKDGFVAWKELEDANIYDPEKAKPYIRRFRRGMLLMTRWFDHLWD